MFWYPRYDYACGKKLNSLGISTLTPLGVMVLSYTRSFTKALKTQRLSPGMAAEVSISYVVEELRHDREPTLMGLAAAIPD